MESSGRGDGAPDDPDTIAKVVEQLISHGYLDQMRRECLVEVDPKVDFSRSNNRFIAKCRSDTCKV